MNTMQQLVNEIKQVKINVEASIKTLQEIGNKHDNRVRAAENRRQLSNFHDHIIDLQKRMTDMRKESDSNWSVDTFDQTKQNALKTLADLSNALNMVDTGPEKRFGTTTSIQSTDKNKNTKGVGALISTLPFNHTQQMASSVSTSGEETVSDEEAEEVVTDMPVEPSRSTQKLKETETSSDENEDNNNDTHRLSKKFQRRRLTDRSHENSSRSDSQSQASISSHTNKKLPEARTHSTPIIGKKPVPPSSSASTRIKIPNPPQPTTVPIAEQSDGSDNTSSSSSSDDDNDDDGSDDELKKLHVSSAEESVHSSDEIEKDEPVEANTDIQQLRQGTYLPGTQFHVTYDLNGLQTGDLTIRKGEILTLIEQRPDDWWLFENHKTQQQGVVPINHIRLHSTTYARGSRSFIMPVTPASTLIDAFKRDNSIPSGFITSDLAPLTQQNQYKLSYTLIPKRTESNFAFSDLHWRYDTEQIHIQQARYQKILTIQKCSKIPQIKRDQIRVLNRCVRVCLYDGFEIISNIYSIRAQRKIKTHKRDSTEEWYFDFTNKRKYVDEQSRLLIRSNEYDRSKHLNLLIELSQYCQSKISKETFEISCGWRMISFDDDDNRSGVFSRTNKYNECLHGGHLHEINIPLHSKYKNFHFEGLSGRIDRYKQARIRFSIESREEYVDVLYDNLPLTSMIVPISLIRMLVFYRNELAHQLQKRYHSNRLSTVPLDSIFLSTFYQALEQPDLICCLQRLYNRPKDLPIRQQCEKFIKTYESSIYPLLFCRSLPPYDFHNALTLQERRNLIRELLNEQLEHKKSNILDILLDANLTSTWAPFTTDEICFSLQNYTHSLHRN